MLDYSWVSRIFVAHFLGIEPIFFFLTLIFKTKKSIISPALTGIILGSDPTIDQWRFVFYISAIINFVGAIIWILFASGKQQL